MDAEGKKQMTLSVIHSKWKHKKKRLQCLHESSAQHFEADSYKKENKVE